MEPRICGIAAAAGTAMRALAAALLFGGSAGADPIVYAVDRTFAMRVFAVTKEDVFCSDDSFGLARVPAGSACPSLRLHGTMTTDGTLGAWEISEHLLAMDLTLSDGASSARLDTREGWFAAEGDRLLGMAAIGPTLTRLSDSVSGAGWSALCVERVAVYECASAFGITITLVVGQPPHAPLGVAIPEPSTVMMLGFGLLVLHHLPRTDTPSSDAPPA